MKRWVRDSIKGSLQRLGVDVRSIDHTERGILRHLLESVRPAAVLDVGANVGQYARLLRAVGYRGTIVSFEAVGSVHARLSLAARADPAWIVAPCLALGAMAGRSTIHVSANTASSSLRGVLPVSVEVAPESAQVGLQEVAIRRLDAVLPEVWSGSGDLMLKIDTQGYEQEVLLGASDVLTRVTALQLELSLTPLYAGAPTLSAMVSGVEALGFELFNLVPGFRDHRSGRLLQADGFFVRPHDRPPVVAG
jgi:FkbM family methyltransferase